jgi:hypothetical protein
MFRHLNLLKLTALALLLVSLQCIIFPTATNVSAASTTYYVAKNGLDSNPGTESQPWLTIQKAARTLVAGNTVLVKTGTYKEKVTPANSGTSGNLITYKAYPGNTPILDGTGITSSSIGLFQISGKSYIEIDGFELQNSDAYGVRVYGSSTTHHINLKNLKVHDIWDSGISVSFSGSTKPTNMLVDSCETYNTNIGGTSESITFAGIDQFEIKNCLVHDVKGSTNYANIKEGIDLKCGCSNGSVHNNEVYNSRIGIYVDCYGYNTSNIAIFSNNLHNNSVNGLNITSEQGTAVMTGMNIYNNLIYENGRGFNVGNHTNFTVDFSFINNTLYHNGLDSEIWVSNTLGIVKNSIIRNNIIVANSKYSYLIQYSSAITGVSVDHNLFYNTSGYTGVTNRLGTSYKQANPLLVDPSTKNFSIKIGSPAIDAGSLTNAPLTDYFGTTRPRGSSIDIGADEY